MESIQSILSSLKAMDDKIHTGFSNMGTWMDNSVKAIHQRLDEQVEDLHVTHEAINAKFIGVDTTLARADEALGALRGEMRANVLPPRSSLPLPLLTTHGK